MRRRSLVIVATTLLLVAVVGGALAFSWAERIPLVEGLMISVSVVSTVGFGEGPTTTAGVLLFTGMFTMTVAAYFLLVMVAFELAMQRIENDRLRRLRMQWSEKDALRLLDELSRN